MVHKFPLNLINKEFSNYFSTKQVEHFLLVKLLKQFKLTYFPQSKLLAPPRTRRIGEAYVLPGPKPVAWPSLKGTSLTRPPRLPRPSLPQTRLLPGPQRPVRGWF